MNRTCLMLAAASIACSSALANEAPCLPGDWAVGTNRGLDSEFDDMGMLVDVTRTVEQARQGGDGLPVFVDYFGEDATPLVGFAQSMMFDNAGGVPRNAAGNLLALNFGPPDPGDGMGDGPGGLQAWSTDGSGQATTIFEYENAGFGVDRTRVVGLGVNTDNSVVSAMAWNSGRFVFCEFDDGGASAGDGLSASVTDAWQTAQEVDASETQGTAWLDADTMVVGALDFGAFKVFTIDIDTATNTYVRTDRILSGLGSGIGNPNHMAIEHVPSVSPYVFILYGDFSGTTVNTMDVVDPATWTIVDTVSLSTSLGTARELTFGADGALYMGQFNDHLDRLDISMLPSPIPDNSSTDHYFLQNSASFSGVTCALGTSATFATGACCSYFTPGGIPVNINAEETDCVQNGGSYGGDGTDASTCPPLNGACCTAGVCTDVAAVDCITGGGSFLGAGSSCAEALCSLPNGACVQLNGTCSDTGNGEDCTVAGGYYMGDGTTCGASIGDTVIAKDDFDAVRQATSFSVTPDLSGSDIPGTWLIGGVGSRFDVFGLTDRTVNFDFADDSAGTFAADTQGAIDTGETDVFFGLEDTTNTPNPTGNASASWTFDVSGFQDLRVSIEFTGMGEYEISDVLTFTAQVDANAPVDIFVLNILTARTVYTMESGTEVISATGNFDRPLRISNGDLSRSSYVLNDYIRLISDDLGTGSTLTLTLAANTDGGGEIIAFDDVCVLGNTAVATGGACCLRSEVGCVDVASEALCLARAGTYQGDGTDCATTTTCGCPCEFALPQNGEVDATDLLAFLAFWFPDQNNNPPAFVGGRSDYNGDGVYSSLDLLAFLSCWFPANADEPCP